MSDTADHGRIEETLAYLYSDPGERDRWLRTPHPKLGGVPPALRILQGWYEREA